MKEQEMTDDIAHIVWFEELRRADSFIAVKRRVAAAEEAAGGLAARER